ncbi:hypothetical protein HK107_09305 [Parvularcula sp. ZS-1/3]|uniref:Uncharacterized protein n=1 Tax=Parvularcula mediterranea TaxID=2732508 RepID=A0A7Y3RMU2_9PROT|nr:hypothetical protein [Parvularcula mediterranea]NNU16515.1 hypothetical protein [Parvularcula mediterranea]
MKLIGWLAALAALVSPALAQKDVTPLFAEDATLAITLTGPFKELRSRAGDEEPQRYDAVMRLEGTSAETHAINLQARGNFRRDRKNCGFPPLRLRINEKPGDASLFDRQRSLKLVTHCRDRAQYRDYLLAEYTAYRLYGLLTEESFKVRLLDITYVEEADGSVVTTQSAFFIEDIDDLADRFGKDEVEADRATQEALVADAAGRLSVFQYMIGNTDWSVLRGREDDPCCHNMKMIGATEEARTDLTPIPYDFDHAGLIDARYATPPPGLDLDSVRERRYRGFCRHNTEARATIEKTVSMKDAFLAEVARTPGLTDRKRGAMRRYLEGYFRDVRSEDIAERKLLRDCR